MNIQVLKNHIRLFFKRHLESKHFCIIPWIHMYVAPNGDISACCLENHQSVSFGNWNSTSLESAWNSTDIKKLRQDLKADRARPDVCSRCYMREEHTGTSHRTEYNWRFRKFKKNALKQTDDSGHMKSMELRYWDFRFSNLCNLRCRTCGPVFSSAWVRDAEKMGWQAPTAPSLTLRSNRMQDVEAQIAYAEEIYFAGGEPLLNKEHYRILELLIEQKRTDVLLSYNSNCTQLQLGDKSALAMWRHFKNINLSPSVDELGTQAEFLRKGTNWSQLIENIKNIRTEIPWANISPTITVSVFNVLRIGDIIESLIDLNIIGKDAFGFQINMVDFPEHYHVGILTPDLKELALQRLQAARIKLTTRYGNYFGSFLLIEESIKKDMSSYRQSFLHTVDSLDRVRNENTYTVYPELKGLRDVARS